MDKTPAIPYVAPYDGPRRELILILSHGAVLARSATVQLDGAAYQLPWGTHYFEIPASRPVAIGVHLALERVVGTASVVLKPEDEAALEYRGPSISLADGVLGPVGTVRSAGRGAAACQAIVIGIALAGLIAIVLVLLSL